MTGKHRNIAVIAAVVVLMQPACAPRNDDGEFDHPPDSTYVVSTGQVQHEGTLTEVRAAQVTAGFFGVINRPPWLGRVFVPHDFSADAEPVVVLSHQLWDNQLGSRPEIVGTTIQLDGRDHTVIGVMPSGIVWPPGVVLWIPQIKEP